MKYILLEESKKLSLCGGVIFFYVHMWKYMVLFLFFFQE